MLDSIGPPVPSPTYLSACLPDRAGQARMHDTRGRTVDETRSASACVPIEENKGTFCFFDFDLSTLKSDVVDRPLCRPHTLTRATILGPVSRSMQSSPQRRIVAAPRGRRDADRYSFRAVQTTHQLSPSSLVTQVAYPPACMMKGPVSLGVVRWVCRRSFVQKKKGGGGIA